jgi:multiple sugar transport system ATP-binding protein
MAIVSLDGITKRFGDTVAVQDFSLETEDGEFIVMVGPSGCGKSTMLRMLAGLEEISGGRIRIDGHEVQNIPPKDRNIAMVFQNYALYPHMDVFTNIAFSLQMRSVPKAQIATGVHEAARVLGIEHLLKRKPRELSGGQRQRVALGRAIVREPQIFLMDEPLSNLDAKLRVNMRAEISKLHKRLGVTSFYVTHDQIEALTMGQRIVVMRDGHIQQIGAPSELYDHPVNQFVAGFIGNPAMNFLRANLDIDALRLRGPSYQLEIPDRLSGPVKRYGSSAELLIGVRPEHLSVSKEEASANTITGQVELVELLGPVTEIQINVDDTVVVAQIDRDVPVHTGESLTLRADTSHLHLFDIKTEQSLLSPA